MRTLCVSSRERCCGPICTMTSRRCSVACLAPPLPRWRVSSGANLPQPRVAAHSFFIMIIFLKGSGSSVFKPSSKSFDSARSHDTTKMPEIQMCAASPSCVASRLHGMSSFCTTRRRAPVEAMAEECDETDSFMTIDELEARPLQLRPLECRTDLCLVPETRRERDRHQEAEGGRDEHCCQRYHDTKKGFGSNFAMRERPTSCANDCLDLMRLLAIEPSTGTLRRKGTL